VQVSFVKDIDQMDSMLESKQSLQVSKSAQEEESGFEVQNNLMNDSNIIGQD
jgi:hypothetical protein